MPSLDVISVNIWQIIVSLCNLLILFLIIKKFLYRPVRRMLADRQQAIDEQYKAADEAVALALRDKEAYSIQLAGAGKECDSLLKNAQLNASRRSEEIVAAAEDKAAGILRRANTDIELERKKAVSGLRREIAGISVELTEKMLDREINAADHRNLIDDFIEGIGDDDVKSK